MGYSLHIFSFIFIFLLYILILGILCLNNPEGLYIQLNQMFVNEKIIVKWKHRGLQEISVASFGVVRVQKWKKKYVVLWNIWIFTCFLILLFQKNDGCDYFRWAKNMLLNETNTILSRMRRPSFDGDTTTSHIDLLRTLLKESKEKQVVPVDLSSFFLLLIVRK